MRHWKAVFAVFPAVLTLLFVSCATDPGFKDYREGLFYGSKALENGEYQTALSQFVRAGKGEPDKPMPFALAGHAAYQLGDFSGAGRYLAEAQRLDPRQQTESWVIIKGFQALIAFREGRRDAGMAELSEYIKFYRHSYPDSTYDEVKRMYDSGNINVAGLESLILHQMTRFEKEIFLAF